MKELLQELIQSLVLILMAPLIAGVIKRVKALLQGRHGPPVLQPYYDLRKWFHKGSVVSKHASWLYRGTPSIVFSAMVIVSVLIPAIGSYALLAFAGDLIAVLYVLAVARFFLLLAGLDTGSSFGAMGSSRDAFLSALVEPVLAVTLLAIALPVQSTDIARIVSIGGAHGLIHISPPSLILALSFLIVMIADTGRLPVDNLDTHLELTMIHEGMLLEYAGKDLALLSWGSWLKQIVFFTLFIDFFAPWGVALNDSWSAFVLGLLAFIIKLLGLSVLIAFVEMSYPKLRFFRVPRLLFGAFVLSLFAIVAQYFLAGGLA